MIEDDDDEGSKKKYYCPDRKCKQHKVYMTIEDNWDHLTAQHKAHLGTPLYRKLQ